MSWLSKTETKEELNAIKEEVETIGKKLSELSEEELAQVSGGLAPEVARMLNLSKGSKY